MRAEQGAKVRVEHVSEVVLDNVYLVLPLLHHLDGGRVLAVLVVLN